MNRVWLCARVLKFPIWIPHGKIADTCFLSWLSYLPFWSYAPLKKSEWNLMHAISYEPCMLGFWNFSYMDSSWKISWPIFFLVPVISLSGIMPLWKKSVWNLVSKISQKVFELGAWNLVSWWGWWVDYLMKFKKKKKNHLIFPELWPFENLGLLILQVRYLEKYLR